MDRRNLISKFDGIWNLKCDIRSMQADLRQKEDDLKALIIDSGAMELLRVDYARIGMIAKRER